MRQMILGAMLACVVLGAEGADKNGSAYFWGTRTCGKYLNDVKQGRVESLFVTGWIAGFISAYNTLALDTHDILGSSDMESAVSFIRNFCSTNPLKNVEDAMPPLIETLDPKRYRSQKEAGH